MIIDRVTPEDIKGDLPDNVIFVFGSNESGIHGAGAARLAYDSYGARLNKGFGFSGQSFAIPTKDWNIHPLPLSVIQFYIDRFLVYTQKRCILNNIKYYVTRIGCGLAGYTPEEIAPLFKEAIFLENIWLPQDFINIINTYYVNTTTN